MEGLNGIRWLLKYFFADFTLSQSVKPLPQNKSFSGRCLKRIELISSEIVTAEEQAEQEESTNDANENN